MIWESIKMAFMSLRSAKLRSFLTMLGIIIGVAAVTSVVSIGNGVKKSIAGEIAAFGTDLIQVNPGQAFTEDENGQQGGFNFASTLGASTLTEQDVEDIRQTPGVKSVAPAMLISGTISYQDQNASPLVMASTPEIEDIFKPTLPLYKGKFFAPDSNEMVVTEAVAKKLFGDQDPLGKQVTLRNRSFTVVGITKAPEGGMSLSAGFTDNTALISFKAGKELSGGVANIMEIDFKAANVDEVAAVKQSVKDRLLENHGGEEDFTVSTPDEQLAVVNQILSLITTFVAAIASISLLVGGVGIMNIMLVSVTERTREIGIRKAIGATRAIIAAQFLIEALILSLIGGLLGLGLAYLQGIATKQFAGITPVFDVGTMAMAFGVSSLIGIIFGLAPAIRAARKHPIQALRYE